MTPSDWELLQAYVMQGSEPAFEELVERHLNLVYSAALRLVRIPELAEEISQSVFLDLSRQAITMRPDIILPAWLYRVTRLSAIDVLLQESSRQLRETKAMKVTKDPCWQAVRS
jgi:DNA-directed RNA polymerase specialized sigma24 family protein